MPIKIYKYILEPEIYQRIRITNLLEVLSVAEQYGAIVLYAFVSTSEPVSDVDVGVYVFGTGRDIPSREMLGRFLGTVSTAGGNLMWHVFLERKP